MRLDHSHYIAKFLADHKAGRFTNNSVLGINRAIAAPAFRVIGIHKLTPDENRSKRNLYAEVIDEASKRLLEELDWGWAGQRPNQVVQPVKLDKPANEPAGNISLDWGQVVWARVKGKPSDTIFNATTNLPDEGPEHWNTIGHHSYFVVWMWDEGDSPVIEPDLPPIVVAGDYERGLNDGMELVKAMITEVLKDLHA